MAFNWAHHSKQAILEALTLIGDTTTAHVHHLLMHGDSVYHDLWFLESIALEISGLLAVEDAAVNNLWREATDSLSLGIYAFNGVQSDLMALSEHQTSPKAARLHIPADKQDSNFKGWVSRIEARHVLMPAQVP
ncbi:hypothetical protein EDB89DRAFT_2071858 [Lactarius sanguifluus]|nr:hypothetical protein EDB89DRAFT_2071858 [Lactarius sanguifluus]